MEPILISGSLFLFVPFPFAGNPPEPVCGLGGGPQFSCLATAGQRRFRRPNAPNDPSLFGTFKCGHPAITAPWRLQVTHETKRFKSFSFISQTFPAHRLVIKWSGATVEQKGPFLSALTHSTPPSPFECRRVPAGAASSSRPSYWSVFSAFSLSRQSQIQVPARVISF